MKKIITIFLLLAATILPNISALAEEKIGYIDMPKILSSYSKAKEISKEIESQQVQIQKMINDAKIKIKSAKSEKIRNSMEKKLTAQIQQKNNVFRADYEKKVQVLQSCIFNTVGKVAVDKNLDFIVRKETVIVGGEDITDAVITELNK